MKDVIDRATWQAALHYGDAATEEFYRRLAVGELATTQCTDCRHRCFPPRPFCPACLSEGVEWVSLPSRARLYAFTQQERATRFMKPDVIGLVEIEGLGTILSKINAPFEQLAIGLALELEPFVVSDALTVHAWRPAPSPLGRDTHSEQADP